MIILAEKKLGNGLSFTITEQSRVIAADRWYVKVTGTISLALTAEAFAEMAADAPEISARVRERLGELVEHQLIRDRNFVDAASKNAVVEELVGQLLETVGAYLEADAFPARLLARKYREALEICRIEMGREDASSGGAEEPVDFSHCFR